MLHVKRPVKRGRTAAEKEESVISEKPPQCLAVEHRQFKRPRRLEETLASLSVSASASNAGESMFFRDQRVTSYQFVTYRNDVLILSIIVIVIIVIIIVIVIMY